MINNAVYVCKTRRVVVVLLSRWIVSHSLQRCCSFFCYEYYTYSWFSPKFHYADFPTVKFRGSRHSGIWAFARLRELRLGRLRAVGTGNGRLRHSPSPFFPPPRQEKNGNVCIIFKYRCAVTIASNVRILMTYGMPINTLILYRRPRLLCKETEAFGCVFFIRNFCPFFEYLQLRHSPRDFVCSCCCNFIDYIY